MKNLALISGILLPLWNVPLIWRVVKRRSSADISLWWAVGVWLCICGTMPWALKSEDIVFKSYSMINFVFFTAVAVVAVRFHPMFKK